MTIEHTFMCLEAFVFAMHPHLNEPNWSSVNFPNDFQQIFDEVSKNFLNLIEENFFPELLNASELNPGSMDMSSYDGSQSPRSGGAMTPNSRNKRMRTSFKHHQLRTMKSYFAINQNPDAKDLKQLAQKTGLSKRVLQVDHRPCILLSHSSFDSPQVWFQNARAKWRRNVMRQDGSLQNPNCPQNLTSYTSTEIHTPNSSESDMTPSHSHALEEMHNMSSCMELY